MFLIEEYMFMEKKKELASATSSKMGKAGDGTRTRDSLLGRHTLTQTRFPSAFIPLLTSNTTCPPLQGVSHA